MKRVSDAIGLKLPTTEQRPHHEIKTIEFIAERYNQAPQLNIRIFTAIEDPFLKAEWERLQQESDIFPQSSYHWCATWWKHLGGRRTLHIVMAVDDQGQAVAIAPLCIERHFGSKVLRSFPVHFGDFYTFITSSDEDGTAVDRIVRYITQSNQWTWVRIEQVRETDVLSQSFQKAGYKQKRLTGSVLAFFEGLSWEEYLAKLQKSFRQNIRSRLRKLDRNFEIALRVTTCWDDYQYEYDAMRTMHEQRWCDDNAPHKSNLEIACWREAIRGQFAAGKIVYYQLLFSGDRAAYRLGFIHRGTFYAWHTGYNPHYRVYFPGIMIMACMIQEFMKLGISSVNFMAGDYGWKLDWSPDRAVVSHYMFSSPTKNMRSAFLNLYHHRLRDPMKAWYHLMMKYRLLRVFSRRAIALRQKFAGQR